MSQLIANSISANEDLDAYLRQAVLRHLQCSLGIPSEEASPQQVFHALALAVRDHAIGQRLDTERRYQQANAKRAYYLSMEYLIGRSLKNNLTNLGWRDVARRVLADLGHDLAKVEETEVDAGLGNGGLGRLAACFLDSMATLDLPGFGYGINYDYGLFKQEIRNGEQIETPDNWRRYSSPWEMERPQHAIVVPLYGHVEHTRDRHGNYNPMWIDWKVVIGVPYDHAVIGYGGHTVNYLRLFSARASEEVNMGIFNEGDYLNAVQQKVESETISKVLYPNEWVAAGRELRLAQEYFLVACSLRDIVGQYLRKHDDFSRFPDVVAIQLNDTHPALSVAELMRLLIDENDLEWEQAWNITEATFAYTNHTLMKEALERWPTTLLERVVPRHLQIIYEINQRFLDQVALRWPGDQGRIKRLSLIEEGIPKQVRMAHLSIVGAHSVNGVAAVHSELVKEELVPDFNELWPEKFNNKTNGITPRRWLLSANPGLASLITETIGDGWITQLDHLRQLESSVKDTSFQERFRAVKRENKERLATLIRKTTGVKIDCDSVFDVHIKRFHEYKRQLLNVLHVVHEYLCLVDEGIEPLQPRTYLFAGKAAPGYYDAKRIIRLINDLSQIINKDPRVKNMLRIVLVPDYRVSLAEVMIPAADLSEQISTAGTEASGTGNMKFALNGALTIGTLDGANIEIREEVGAENVFIFGLTVDEVREMQWQWAYHPWEIYQQEISVRRVMDAFRENRFCPRSPGFHQWVCNKLLADYEPYFHLADFMSYLEAHAEVEKLYQDRSEWTTKAILNVARMGRFSSDRAIREYADEVWKLKSIP